jgi:predicted LPLAT superfamily acyltransferase
VTDPKALLTEPNLADPDAAYRLIVQAHRDLSEAESAAFNARLVLILANHLGDVEILRQALALAREAR